MKNNTIIRAIGGIDDTLIERAAPQPKAELNGTEISEQKRRPVRFIPLLAAVIALLSFATIAVANHFNVFDRLREIVGGEMAETLQQVEIDEEKRVVTDAGFSFEFVAVGVLSNVVDIYLIIEDLEGNRLDDTVEVFGDVTVIGDGARFPTAIIDGEEIIVGEQLPTAPSLSEIISLTDDGVLTLRNRFVFDRSITEQDLVYNLRGMQYNFREAKIDIDYDLASLVEQTPTATIWDTPILTPHTHDIDMNLKGFENAGRVSISSIGILNGRLHVQEQYCSVALRQWVGNRVRIIDPQGNILQPLRGTEDNTETISFRIDRNGVLYNDRGYLHVVDFPYRENVFEVDLTRLSEYRLAAFLRTNNNTELNGSFAFSIEIPAYQDELVAEGMEWDVRFYDDYTSRETIVTFTEARLSPISLTLVGFEEFLDDGRSTYFADDVKIRMIDGTVTDVHSGWGIIGNVEGGITFTIHFEIDVIDLLDLSQVYAIEIAREAITFD